MRARDLSITIGQGSPGPHNAITDVPGVAVGHVTLIEGSGKLEVGKGPIRTGVTVIKAHDGLLWQEPVFAGVHRLNGNGEMTGTEWIREVGMLTAPIALTNTHSVGTVRDALIATERPLHDPADLYWRLPVVAETWDGVLNDIHGQHIRPEHVQQAFDSARSGPVAEGNVGGGTGMICHDFKGGIGTASRALSNRLAGYSVGVLVQANYGRRQRFRVNGLPVGEHLTVEHIPDPDMPAHGAGSIIVVAATDVPLLPIQCTRLAQRAGLGIARVGGTGEHWSGDLFIAFSTASRGAIPASDYGAPTPLLADVRMLSNSAITPVFDAVVEATEEAILNALLAAETMTGRDDITAQRLDPDMLREVLARFAWPGS